MNTLPGELSGWGHSMEVELHMWLWQVPALPQGPLALLPDGPFILNPSTHPCSTALLVQPLRLPPASAAAGSSSSRPQLSEAAPITTIDVPLPLTLLPGGEGAEPGSRQGAAAGPAAPAAADSWNPFENGGGSSGNGASSGSGVSSGSNSQPARAVGYLPSGDAQEVVLPPGLPAALQQLGLGGALGFLRLLAEAPEGTAAGTADEDAVGGAAGGASASEQQQQQAAGGQQGEQRWLPLALWLGMPMQPCQLCRAVCNAALDRGFLERAALRSQREGQAALAAALAAQAAAHGACSTAFAGGGRDDDLGSYVDRPVQNLELVGGRLVPADLGGAAEGAPLLLA